MTETRAASNSKRRAAYGECVRVSNAALRALSPLLASAFMPPRTWWMFTWLVIASATLHAQEAVNPRIWIFNGTPGDAEHHEFYVKNLERLRNTLKSRFGMPAEKMTVLYGPKDEGYDGPCTREALLGELAKAANYTRQPNAGPVWLIFQGHANRIPGGLNYNLPGPDVNGRDIADALKGAAANAPIVLISTMTCSASLV